MIIPFNTIDADTLRRIAEEFVTRDGTDYGEVELGLEEKVRRLLLNIEQNRVLIVFNEEQESVNLIDADDYQDSRLEGG